MGPFINPAKASRSLEPRIVQALPPRHDRPDSDRQRLAAVWLTRRMACPGTRRLFKCGLCVWCLTCVPGCARWLKAAEFPPGEGTRCPVDRLPNVLDDSSTAKDGKRCHIQRQSKGVGGTSNTGSKEAGVTSTAIRARHARPGCGGLGGSSGFVATLDSRLHRHPTVRRPATGAMRRRASAAAVACRRAAPVDVCPRCARPPPPIAHGVL